MLLTCPLPKGVINWAYITIHWADINIHWAYINIHELDLIELMPGCPSSNTQFGYHLGNPNSTQMMPK